ncbi:hypothetical protein PR048_020604 [Dryococelus australis]|uniref:Retrotransposon gag domain-containing protein n=1 Tax=Dryococelus australis TaxID=614101 RepID=A0ABQ9H759_9NEOP|nr:hypothetical protein PR048_020604 [Dryococelus australis]
MGDKAEEIWAQFQPTPTTFANAVHAFDEYFNPSKNIIFERFRFNSRAQLPGETVTDFITALQGLVERCDYGTLKQELICDRIVAELSDVKTSEQLQLLPELT